MALIFSTMERVDTLYLQTFTSSLCICVSWLSFHLASSNSLDHGVDLSRDPSSDNWTLLKTTLSCYTFPLICFSPGTTITSMLILLTVYFR